MSLLNFTSIFYKNFLTRQISTIQDTPLIGTLFLAIRYSLNSSIFVNFKLIMTALYT